MEEAVLRYGVGDGRGHAAQLGHLLKRYRAAQREGWVSIPFSVLERAMWTFEAFTVFDDARVHVELLSAPGHRHRPGEVVVISAAFGPSRQTAVYGQRRAD